MIIKLPFELLQCTRLVGFDYYDNPVENIHPLITRWLNRLRSRQIAVYNDAQSVHNHNIQESVKTSLINIFRDEPLLTYEQVNRMILEDTILAPTTKAILVEYSNDSTEHSVLLITFKDLLVQVWQRLYSNDDRNEIKQILNQEMSDSLCKCFTGRLSRLINVLNGFYDDITVKIGSNDQIGNIIAIVRAKLGAEYSIAKHKTLVIAELREREYSDEVIEAWISFIE